MNGTTTSFVTEMLNCVGANMPVSERQRARFKWQQLQQQQREEELIGYYDNLGELGEVVTRSVKPDPGLNGWPDLGGWFGRSNVGDVENGVGLEENFGVYKTCSCPPPLPGSKDPVVPVGGQEKVASGGGDGARASLKKRKADKVVVAEGEEWRREKMSKGYIEEEESKTTKKVTNNNNNKKEHSGETSKDNQSKVTEVQKPEYIHVRARRGQATDSHSLAERVRREKISERMRYLQDLVPGCNKITGKAGMLDEIINYVQSLQKQVEFLSMKLAAVNPRVDCNIDNLSAKQVFPGCSTNFPYFGMPTDMTNDAYLQLNPLQEPIVTCNGLDVGINPLDMELRRTTSTPLSIPEAFIDSSCFNQIQPIPTWDADVQNICNVAFDQGRQATLLSQPFTGPIQAGNLKMEM